MGVVVPTPTLPEAFITNWLPPVPFVFTLNRSAVCPETPERARTAVVFDSEPIFIRAPRSVDPPT